MNIVLDTNVLVAGLLSPFGPCGEIVRLVSAGEVILTFDARILCEYSEVLARPKFRFDQEKVGILLDWIERQGVVVVGVPLEQPLPDRDDEPFLEVALAKPQVTCLVTGNQVHFPDERCQSVKVLTPAQFTLFYLENR